MKIVHQRVSSRSGETLQKSEVFEDGWRLLVLGGNLYLQCRSSGIQPPFAHYLKLSTSERSLISPVLSRIMERTDVRHFLCTKLVTRVSSNAIRYVLPVLCMTHIFTKWSEWIKIKDDAHVSSSCSGGGTGRKVCRRLRLH